MLCSAQTTKLSHSTDGGGDGGGNDGGRGGNGGDRGNDHCLMIAQWKMRSNPPCNTKLVYICKEA